MRARFWVQSVELKAAAGDEVIAVVKLAPVVRNVATDNGYESDNIDWSKYTPSGSIEFTVTQAAARDYWTERLGKDVKILFSDPEEPRSAG